MRSHLPVLLAGILCASCALASAPASPRAGESQITFTARIVGERGRDQARTYTLADGGEVTVDPSVDRVIKHHGTAELLVRGSDANGAWVATIGTQGGLPDDCYVLNEDGIEMGDGIEIAGVRWPKAPGFAFQPLPPLGTGYVSGSRFCIDTTAHVTSIVPPAR
jgi:hypothetical protein